MLLLSDGLFYTKPECERNSNTLSNEGEPTQLVNHYPEHKIKLLNKNLEKLKSELPTDIALTRNASRVE